MTDQTNSDTPRTDSYIKYHRDMEYIDFMRTLERALAESERKLAEAQARYIWLADKVLACDYGDNDTQGEAVGWNIRHCKGPDKIYGTSIDAAIDAAMVKP